jgi:hypothetical protein
VVKPESMGVWSDSEVVARNELSPGISPDEDSLLLK